MVSSRRSQLTLDEAYQATFLWLDHIGDPPVEVAEQAHGSIELHTDKAFVRVRLSETPVEQSSVLALLRAADRGKRLLLFSPSGFSPGAISIAETQGIALFTLDPQGRAFAETTYARSLAPEDEPEPPFTNAPENVDEGFPLQKPEPSPKPPPDMSMSSSRSTGVADGTSADWSDCPACGTTHYGSARFCKECGANLQDAAAPETAKMRCRSCGSHDIEILS